MREYYMMGYRDGFKARDEAKPVDRSMINEGGYAVDRCPTCFEYVDRTNYCPNCGQKLKHE
jgi:predicted amidophosphoribosyltransferase